MDCIRRTVLTPAGMAETWSRVPPPRLDDCECYDGEHRIEGDRRIVRSGRRGVPHDPKAAILQGTAATSAATRDCFPPGRISCGSAGRCCPAGS